MKLCTTSETISFAKSLEETAGEFYQALSERQGAFRTLRAIGDCHAPGTIAAAVYDGHSAARYLDSDEDIYAPLFNRDMPALD